MSYQHKYLKYKQKYLSLKNSLNINMVGGNPDEPQNQENDLLNLSSLPITPTDTEVYGHTLKSFGGEPQEQVTNHGKEKSEQKTSTEESTLSESVTSEQTTSIEESTDKNSSTETDDSPIEVPEIKAEQAEINTIIGGNGEIDTLDISELSSISDSELN